ncbi:hypothetical protein GXB85_12885 [Cellulomonas sp. APG4]|uniref:hypothetical protein n=1 Tax=Cellulomonas sp. APG4 TaxID=1538656 RepID=UPI00137A702E|nr:hypothetical protein [Cellulomonas sp. APG4]NCT91841.1 hypothetical protein [Cellulomonas sp. APG4]
MAAQAFGVLLSVDETAARYDSGRREEDPERGVLVSPASGPNAWHMEGREDRPHWAGTVVARALYLRTQTGEWPTNASFQS